MTFKIAITGSSGFVGSALVSKLLERQAELKLLRRPDRRSPSAFPNAQSTGKQDSAAANLTEVLWDPAGGVQDASQLEDLDAIIHLAGRSIGMRRWSRDEKRRLRDSRVQATEVLVRQVSELSAKPRIFLSASAIGIYGNTGNAWVSETTASSSDFLGELAHSWEQASQSLGEQGIRVIHARLGIVLGLSGGALAQMLPVFRWGLGGILGHGNQFWSWISLEDCCRALLHVLDHQQCSGPYNVVSPEPVTNRQFTHALGQAVHRPTVIPAPAFALRCVLGETADALLLSSCRVRPERLQQSGFRFNDPNLVEFLQQVLRRGSH